MDPRGCAEPGPTAPGGGRAGADAAAELACACVTVPALPLQLALRAHPEAAALAVLDRAGAQGRVLHASRAAGARGVAPGQSQAQALALCPALRLVPHDAPAVAREVAQLVRALHGFSPAVEPARPPIAPGVLWLDARGLWRLHPSPRRWAAAVQAALRARGLRATVVLGASRFGSYAVAQALAPGALRVLPGAAAERRACHDVTLDRLGLPGAIAARLARLGVTTLGGFLALPRAGLHRRFGAEVAAFHAWAAGAFSPVQGAPADEPVQASRSLDDGGPPGDRAALLFLCKPLLHQVLAGLRARGQALLELTVRLSLRGGGGARIVEDVLRPADSARDADGLLELLRLRSESWSLQGELREVSLRARGIAARPEQLTLGRCPDHLTLGASGARPRRERAAAERALARVRAQLGEQAVVVAELRDGILPEARFVWRPLAALPEPAFRPRADARPAAPEAPAQAPAHVVRRFFSPALRLPEVAGAGRHDDGWLLAGVVGGAVERLDGPYVLSGGWWRAELRRDYHFATLRSGRRLWVFHDRVRRGWYLHGRIE